MSSLREIIATFGVKFDDSELKRGSASLNSAAGALKGFGLALAGSAVVVGLKSMMDDLMAQSGALVDNSNALGISAKQLEEWGYAAQLSGSSLEEFSAAFTKYTKNVGEAESATGAAAEAFAALGVSVKDESGALRAPIDTLDEVVAGLQRIESPAKKTATVMALFGRSGAKLLPLFNEGPEGIAKLRAEMQALGGGLSGNGLANFEELGDNMDRLDFAGTSLKATIGNALIPIMTRLVTGVAFAIAKMRGWAKGLGEVLGRSNILQSAMTWFGTIGVASLFRAVGGFRGLALILGRFVPILGRILLVFGRFLLAFILPALILDDLITTIQGGDSITRRVLDSIAEKFRKLFPELSTEVAKFFEIFKTVSSIARDAISGDWETVGNKLMAIWAVVQEAAGIVAFEIGALFVGAAATAQDAFAVAMNAIIEGIQSALNLIGATNISAGLGDFKLGTDNAKNFDAESSQARQAVAERAERVVSSANKTLTTKVVVNVPPGTPATMANRVGEAAQKGAAKGGRASLGALARVAP